MDQTLEKDDFDLKTYLMVLAKRWHLIRDLVIVALLGGVLFGLYNVSAIFTYQATAGVAIIKSKTTLNFDDKIKTVSPDLSAAASLTAGVQQDAVTRRSTLASLVQSPLLAQDVINNMGARLPDILRDPDALVPMVEGQVRKGTDVVEVIVSGGDPSLVTDIANAWAVAYERYVNRIYSGNVSSTANLSQEVADAKVNYENARDALLQYNVEDKSYQLQRDIDYRKGVIDTLHKTRQATITAILGKQAEVQTDFMAKYQSAALNMMGLPVIKQVEDKVSKLSALYANKQKIGQTLEDARTLRDQASKSPSGADSNSLSLLLVKAQLATGGGLPSGLQLQVGAPSPGEGGSSGQISDLDALISTLNSRLQEIQADIDRESAELVQGGGIQVGKAGATDSSDNPLIVQAQKMAGDLLQLKGMEGMLANVDADKGSPLTEKMDQLTMEVRQLEADLAREQYRKKELTRNYDIGWQAYSVLSGKEQEMDIASQLPGSEVVFASPAIQPATIGARGVLSQLLKALVYGAAAGLLLGIGGVFAVEYFSPESPNGGIPWRSLTGRGWAVVEAGRRRVFRRPITYKKKVS